MDVEALIRPVVEGTGLELEEATFRREAGRQILRVTIDRDGGVDLDTIATVSERLSRRLDLEDFGRGRYELEVSTPGIERRLKTPGQFRRSVGTTVKVTTSVDVDGAKVHEGVLTDAADDAIVVTVDGTVRRLRLSDVRSARTVVDWVAELKGSRT
jgi:ribosome maturation factor RimP